MAGPVTMMMIGMAMSAGGTLAGGAADQAAADTQAMQLDQQAGQRRATAQRQAVESRREAKLLESRALAVGAASGGGVDFTRIGDIAAEGEYRALASLYEGEEGALGLEAQAGAARTSGKNAMGAATFDAAGTLLKGGTTMMEKYG